MDGSCLASPRWVSLLVAEIYYPDATFPNPAAPSRGQLNQNRNPVQGNSPPGVSSSKTSNPFMCFYDRVRSSVFRIEFQESGISF